MQVICIDDSNKPSRIANSEWIKKGTIYTVLKAVRMHLQPGKFGFYLKEVELSELSFPYEVYDSSRFAILDGEVLIEENIKEEEVVFEI